MLTYIHAGDAVTILDDLFVPHTAPASAELLEVLNDPSATFDDVRPFLTPEAIIVSAFDGTQLTVKNGQIEFDGQPLRSNALARLLLDLCKEPNVETLVQPYVNFLARCQKNPSFRAVNDLFDWLQASGLPILPDGRFVAYKIVRHDYRDYHSGKFDHTPGQSPEMPRNQVDENPDQTCSSGLHFCSAAYLPAYYQGDADRRIVAVAIDPADVAAFPRDYGLAKGRCCKMEVLKDVTDDIGMPKFVDTSYEPDRGFAVGDRVKDIEGYIGTIVDKDFDVFEVEYPDFSTTWWPEDDLTLLND